MMMCREHVTHLRNPRAKSFRPVNSVERIRARASIERMCGHRGNTVRFQPANRSVLGLLGFIGSMFHH